MRPQENRWKVFTNFINLHLNYSKMYRCENEIYKITLFTGVHTYKKEQGLSTKNSF